MGSVCARVLVCMRVRLSNDALAVCFQVTWVRRRDWHILTTGISTYTNDERFQVLHPEGSDDWTLQIKYVQRRDNGTYECQVSAASSRFPDFPRGSRNLIPRDHGASLWILPPHSGLFTFPASRPTRFGYTARVLGPPASVFRNCVCRNPKNEAAPTLPGPFRCVLGGRHSPPSGPCPFPKHSSAHTHTCTPGS